MPKGKIKSLADLKPDPRNANRGTERGDYLLETSIQRYGLGRSILTDRNGVILAGNKTHAKAGELGFSDVIEVETDGRQLVVVRRTDLEHGTPEATGLALADNRTSEVNLDFDFELVQELAGEFPEEVFAFWQEQEIFANGHGADPPEAKVDEADALREKWDTERGQLWQVGRHRLLCGDATSGDDVERLLGGASPNLMVTDPPYGVEYDASWRDEAAFAGKRTRASRRTRQVANDDRVEWQEAIALFHGDVLYMWLPAGDPIIRTGQAILMMGFEIRNQIIWAKPHIPISRGHYAYRHEPLWYAVRKGATASWIGPPMEHTLWEITLDPNVEGGHSTQKPLECMQRPIRNHEGNVYDPFIGSGTTIVAAEQENRACYAMDIDPAYVAVTLERLASMGLEPERID